jgi:hypothetical protein
MDPQEHRASAGPLRTFTAAAALGRRFAQGGGLHAKEQPQLTRRNARGEWSAILIGRDI